MNRRKLIKSLSGGTFAIWGGSLLGPNAFAQAQKTTTTTTPTSSTTTATTDPTGGT
jgi:hypothetical protein